MFNFTEDPVSVASGQKDFCGVPKFAFTQNLTDPLYKNVSPTGLEIVDA